jgi:hypothetical protein
LNGKGSQAKEGAQHRDAVCFATHVTSPFP